MNTNAKLAGALLLGWTVAITPSFAQSFSSQENKAGVDSTDHRTQSQEFLRRARTAMKGGNLELAERFVSQAEKLNLKYDGFLSRFSDTPEKARKELNRLKAANSKTTKKGTNGLKGLLGKKSGTSPSRLPVDSVQGAGQVASGPQSAQQAQVQARSVMAQAKAAFDRGDLNLADSLTRQAQTFRAPDQAFAGGDTPWELALKIEKQRTLTGGVVPASGSSANAVAPAVYDPAKDTTFVQPASAEEVVSPPLNGLAQQLQGLTPLTPQPSAITLPGSGFPQNAPLSGASGTPYQAQQSFQPEQFSAPASPPPGSLVSPELGSGTTIPVQLEADGGSFENSAAHDLINQGEASIRDGNLDAARDYFRQAWAMNEQLDSVTRQRLQDHLQLLRTDTQNGVNDLSDAEREEAVRVQRFISDVSREQAAISRELRVNPKDAWERMKQLRQHVDEADLPPEARRPLAARLDEAVRETEAFIDANRAQIELDERNREVLDLVDRERKMRVEIQNKLAVMVEDFNGLMDQERYSEAYVLAKQARELAPNNQTTEMMVFKSHFAERTFVESALRERRERMVEFGLDSAHPDTPLAYDERFPMVFPKRWDELSTRRAGLLDDGRSRYNEAEKAIEQALQKKVQVQFNEAPLSEVINTLGQMTGVNVFIDVEGLAAEGVTSDTPVTINLSQEIGLRSVLNLILGQHRLGYVIQDEVLRITSEAAVAGDVYTDTYYVGDLVIPIPNFMPGYNNGMAGALAQAHAALGYGPGGFAHNRQKNAPLVIAETDGDQDAASPLALGQLTSANPMPSMANAPQPLPMGGMGGATGADFDTLINLITATVEPNTWDDVGGPGAIESFEGNLSLVISNTQEVHEAIVDLLEQLRRLQDLQVTIEVRFVTLQDNFFERIGVDFDFDINDDSGLTPADLVDPDFDEDGTDITIGLDPNGNPTLDLDLSFSQNSFASAVPTFGGFDPTAASTFGFAILSDIEAFFVVEAIQGDTRTNVMQAPKITMFNGQFANINDTQSRPFVTSVIPVVGDFAVAQQPVILVLAEGTQLSVQAVVSNDRRFVRLTMLPMFTQIGNVDTFTFEGRTSSDTGTSTETDPDDNTTTTTNNNQFTEGTTVQLPNFASTSVSTTVSVPDGGTVLMGGIKRLAEGRTERGMPILGKLPYVSRLFKNVGTGRETQTLMMMVTPRIIIQEEEEERVLGTP